MKLLFFIAINLIVSYSLTTTPSPSDVSNQMAELVNQLKTFADNNKNTFAQQSDLANLQKMLSSNEERTKTLTELIPLLKQFPSMVNQKMKIMAKSERNYLNLRYIR